jgi:hypothetical protein
LKEGERGNKEEGLGGEKGKRLGGLWLNSHLVPPLPPDPEQGRGQAAQGPAGKGARRRPWPRRRPGDGAKRRGNRGDLDPVLTLDRYRLWRQLRGAERRPAMAVGGGCAWRLGRCGGSAGACARRSGSFYSSGKAVTRPDSELWELRQWRWGEISWR